MIYIPQRIELADGKKCVALEDYDKLATENMLEVNKICKQRDAVIKELKEAWLAMDEIEGTDRINEWQNKNAHFLGTDNMSPELIKITKKVESLREVLKEHGFETLECFWYSDGFYSSNWKDMSVANEKPIRGESATFWQFGFRSQNEKNKRIHLEALMPVFEDYFTFDLRYYPEVKLHDREGYSGPTAKLEVCEILEEDLTNLQKHIDYLLNLK